MKRYTFKNYNPEHMARAVGMALPISFKQSVEICNFIENRKVSDVKKILQAVIDKKEAVPFKRYNWDLGHKKGIGPGRYPEKASMQLIQLIESAESNAQFKGLNTSSLVISHISAHKAGKAWHYGRQSRRQMKRTNVEIIVEEKAKNTDDSKKQKEAKGQKK